MTRLSGLIAALLLFLALGLPASHAAQADSILVVAADVGDVISLDPAHAHEMLNLAIHNAVYETLVTVFANDLGTYQPKLAKSWEVSDDGLTYTFHLVPGVTFASGNPLTAEDVRFSWTRLKNIKDAPAEFVNPVEKMDVVDDLTLVVTLAQPTPAFMSIVAGPSLSVLDSAVVRSHGGTDAEDADVSDQASTWLDQNSAGSGPFILTGWTPNAEVTMVRNDHYWGTPAKLAGVTFHKVNDSSSAFQQLERGDIDIVFNLEKDLAEEVTANPALRLVVGNSLTVTYLGMSPDPELGGALADQKLRQAVAYAIDFDGIANGLLRGYSDRPATMMPIGIMGSDGSLRYERDLDRARELMSEAGYADGVDLTLSLNGTGVCGLPSETIAAKLEADLSDIGIRLTANAMPTTAFRTAYRSQELPMVVSSWTPDYIDATYWSDSFSYADSGASVRLKTNSARMIDIATRAAAEQNLDARGPIFQEWVQAQLDEAVFIPICQNTTLIAMNDRIENFVYHPTFLVDFQTLDIADPA